MNLYNDFDPKCCAWIAELIAAGEIPPGDVLCKSITDIHPDELKPYIQFHAFCGVAGWPLALRLAGWPDDAPIWTGSCPCQPFSVAGQRRGVNDERHLWPAFFKLIEARRPGVVFGEQVASADVLGSAIGKARSKAGPVWFDGVSADLESQGYAVGAAVLGAHSVGAPHIRKRLYWVADAEHTKRWTEPEKHAVTHGWNGFGGSGHIGRLADVQRPRLEGLAGDGHNGNQPGRLNPIPAGPASQGGESGGVGESDSAGSQSGRVAAAPDRHGCSVESAGSWDSFDILPCRDGKFRRVESGTFPLVARLPGGVVPSGDPSLQEVQATAEATVMRLRGYGNSIVPALAVEFIQAYLETK